MGTLESPGLARRFVAEFLGTALLLAVVVGSGIMADRLDGGNVALALLANALAAGAGLIALILTFGPVSGAHFNPVVTLIEAWQRRMDRRDAPVYLLAQFTGAVAGVALAHVMFGHPVVSLSEHVRASRGELVSEFVATFGLIAVIAACARRRPGVTPFAVGLYITSAYWFTASTSFANPAVTIARTLTSTFAGIRATDAPGFMAAQLAGAATSAVLFAWLVPTPRGESAPD